MRSLGYGELIRTNRNFRNLLAGQFISELGNWFNFIAGLGLVRLVSDASPTAAGLFFVSRLLPFALASPIAGTFVDRFSRRTVMIATDLLRSVVALSFLLFSTRFLLMAVGSALGGWAAAVFGYKVAFLINAVSFLISAFTVWLIPEEATRDENTAERMSDKQAREPFITELREGFSYAIK